MYVSSLLTLDFHSYYAADIFESAGVPGTTAALFGEYII